MKKVLYVATVDVHIRSFHLPYLKMLHENGYEVHVATNGKEQFPYCDVKHTICIERSPFKINNLKAIKELKLIIDREKFEIVHCHTPMGSVVARIASINCRKKGTKVIYTAHGFHFYKGAPFLNWLLFYPIEKYLSKYTDTLITINSEDFDLARRKFEKCKDIRYIPGVGIDLTKFSIKLTNKEMQQKRETLGLTAKDIVLIFVARLDKNKNQIFLINVMEELVKQKNDIKLLLVGKDELDGKYQKVVQEKRLSKNVIFLGQRDDIPELMRISDISVSSSLREGLPVNVLEAIASNLPVVALKCRGMEDLISEGKNGFLIDRNAENKMIDDFKNKIIFLFNEYDEYKDKFTMYNDDFIKKFDLGTTLERIEKIYFK